MALVKLRGSPSHTDSLDLLRDMLRIADKSLGSVHHSLSWAEEPGLLPGVTFVPA